MQLSASSALYEAQSGFEANLDERRSRSSFLTTPSAELCARGRGALASTSKGQAGRQSATRDECERGCKRGREHGREQGAKAVPSLRACVDDEVRRVRRSALLHASLSKGALTGAQTTVPADPGAAGREGGVRVACLEQPSPREFPPLCSCSVPLPLPEAADQGRWGCKQGQGGRFLSLDDCLSPRASRERQDPAICW